MSQVQLVPANLGSICIESFLYGIFFILFVTSTGLHVQRVSNPEESSRRSSARAAKLRLLKNPMFIGAIAIFMTVTAHWALSVTRLFDAFVNFKGGQAPLEFYANLNHPTEVVKTGFLVASLLLGDVLLIYRLWIVWSYNKSVIVFPLSIHLASIACSITVVYQFAQYRPGQNVFSSALGRWVTSDMLFTMTINLYSTFCIAFKILKHSTRIQRYGGPSLLRFLSILVESAALYTAWSVFFFATYQSHSNIQFPAIDAFCTISGIAYMLINVRVGLGWAQRANASALGTSGMGSASGQQQSVRQSMPLQPIEVNISHIVKDDFDLAPSKFSRDEQSTASV